MGERRKRKSLWSEEAETKPFIGNHNWIGKDKHPSHDREHDHEFPASGSHGVPKFRYHSGHPSMESIHEDPVAWTNGSFAKGRENAYEGKEIGGEDSYYHDMSSEFKYNHFLEDDRSHSRRYPGRGRSRSRSRSRGRCHSRSLSRGRERERARGGSRSRSRSDSDARGWTRSRSPLGDYKHQASGWSDRRSLSEISTEADFASGRGRRDGFSKYLHPKNTSHRDGGLGGGDTSESRRIRADHGNDSRQSYSRGPRIELRSDVSDPYHGKDEQFQNNSRNAVPCRYIVKGNCRLGDACRYSHNVASDETSIEGTKRSSSDRDPEHQPYRNRNPLCKYFAAGKCDRDNCRFSHEVSRLEGRLGKVNNDRSSRDNDRGARDKVNKRDGLRWDDAGRISDDLKPSGRNSSAVTVTDSTVDNSNTGQNNRTSHSLGNENINWGLPQQTNNLVPVHRAGDVSYDGDVGTTESVIEENMMAKQDILVFHGSQLQNQDGNTNKLQVDQRFPLNTWQQNVSPGSHIQHQNHGAVENNVVSLFHSDVIDEVKDSRNASVPAFVSAQNSHQNGENALVGYSSISMKAGSKEMPHLNGAEMHQVANLDFSQIQKLQNAIQMAGMSETNASLSFPNLAISEQQSAQYTNTLLSTALQQVAPVLNQRFENQHSTKTPVEEVSNSTGMVLSTPNASGYVPLDCTTSIQLNPVTVSHDPFSSVENGRSSSNEHGEGNKMPSTNNSEIDHSGRAKVQQETAHENPECDEVKGGPGEQSKGVQGGKHSETLDGHGKADEGVANKDDKGMRLFKNALIEFVKDKLKPKWKEGRMSRDVHKTIVKKVVDKITSSIQTEHVPKTQEKVEQYLSFSEPKIAKLVQAYVDRCLKTDS
ncbi:zinc finger CCCH domain-containing protein 55-like [Salvia miltiorrhiza]|uniref:zinc finger CCCH domain-containing protein 55-like n=1 Tax=Salvia miltiorrhiza TaxID=226208 RepID=UPI0025ABBABA|nr:zinc finger CCCH domain-containing protein 55-like [Salvia miltiorrhiza]XP_057772679.1 zinc finger CCCH domain-containing protein 55-like [Salvia miltiorrhiza]XP_057772687.1 zinc finger CCCH domain-containing protein 55-like [Salvia miltiorrhiza]